MRRPFGFALWLAALLAVSGPSAAQQSSEMDRAKASFKAGANAYAAGDYLAAIQALEAAYELSPLPAIAFSLAQAERKQYFVKQERQHLERALALFHRYLEQDPRGARREDALAAIALLEPLAGNKPVASAPAAKAEVRPTRLMIVSEAPGARITLDGGPPSPSPLIREVTPGKHRARVEAKGYFDVEREVTAVAGELLLNEVELNERPSSLYVWAPAQSDIYVDGVLVAQGGALATIPLSTGRHQLTVGQKGRRLVRRDVEIARGQTASEVVYLEPTAQRSLSELLFIGGGAALGAGIAISAFAIRSENRAEAFLGNISHKKTQSSADLAFYNASIVERTRYRTAAGICIAGSFGMFITGLFLHELDHPPAPTAPQRDAAPVRTAAGLSPSLRFVPASSDADVGASLQANF